jgi:Uncharacterized protein conserved in bacteria
MIRFDLTCESGHASEGWFRNGDDCDRQLDSGMVSCPECGSTAVSKGIMAPAVARATRSKADTRAAMEAYRRHVMSITEDVGDRFAREVRDMEDGFSEPRPIRGTATSDELRSLHEDGIGFSVLPPAPPTH